MHRDPRYFNVNKHVKICSEHFRQRDFVNPHAKKRRLNRNAVPSKFSWTPVKEEEEEDVERTAVSKLERSTESNKMKLPIPHRREKAMS